MKFTLSLFKQLVDSIPPLFPEEIKNKIRKDLNNIQEGLISVVELEKMMVKYGYEIWPWNQAFKAFVKAVEEKMGEHFLVSNLPESIKEKYLEYRGLGASLKDFHSGRLANYFDEEERRLLTGALIDMQNQVREFAIREVIGLKKEQYLKKLDDFKIILEEIKNDLNRLKALAENEEEHLNLADEIRARVEACEHGLCLLAPEISHEDVKNAHDFFVGRKQELNRLRGIHKKIEIDFYSEEQNV